MSYRLFIFQCQNDNTRYGFTLDQTGGELPVLDCMGWAYIEEVPVFEEKSIVMGVSYAKIMDNINLGGYYIHESEPTRL